jgi:hypothetical protein
LARVKRPGYKADLSLPFSAEFKNVWNFTSKFSLGLMEEEVIKIMITTLM